MEKRKGESGNPLHGMITNIIRNQEYRSIYFRYWNKKKTYKGIQTNCLCAPISDPDKMTKHTKGELPWSFSFSNDQGKSLSHWGSPEVKKWKVKLMKKKNWKKETVSRIIKRLTWMVIFPAIIIIIKNRKKQKKNYFVVGGITILQKEKKRRK